MIGDRAMAVARVSTSLRTGVPEFKSRIPNQCAELQPIPPRQKQCLSFSLSSRRKSLVVTNFTHEPQQKVLEDDVLPSDEPLETNEESTSSPTKDVDNSPQPLSDISLPELPVQTLEEQALIAATPAHPESLYAMYATYVAACFMERVWRFGLPVVISMLSDSLLPVAMLSFVGQLMIFVGGPWVGAVMDTIPRPLAFNFLSVVQTVSMVISASLVVYVLNGGVTTTSRLLLQPWFLVLMVFGALERLTGLACGVAFERDWVVLLAGSNRPIALANANAILRRVDLVCEIAGPFLFGILLSRYSPVTCTYVAAIAMTLQLPLLIYLVHCTYKLSKGVLDRPRVRSSDENKTKEAEKGFRSIQRGWIEYLAQPILPASLAYVLLYFNAVLGPGGLMTSFLTQKGLNPSIVGSFRGLCALMGFVATFVSSAVIRRVGVLKAGLTALVFQASLLLLAVGVYWTTQMRHQGALVAFLILVVVSRLGFWVYDMVDAQIFQTAVSPSQANLVGTTEVSLASLAELVMMGVAIVASDVSHFGRLSALSMLAVIGAAWIYWNWLKNPTDEQRKLFPTT